MVSRQLISQNSVSRKNGYSKLAIEFKSVSAPEACKDDAFALKGMKQIN